MKRILLKFKENGIDSRIRDKYIYIPKLDLKIYKMMNSLKFSIGGEYIILQPLVLGRAIEIINRYLNEDYKKLSELNVYHLYGEWYFLKFKGENVLNYLVGPTRWVNIEDDKPLLLLLLSTLKYTKDLPLHSSWNKISWKNQILRTFGSNPKYKVFYFALSLIVIETEEGIDIAFTNSDYVTHILTKEFFDKLFNEYFSKSSLIDITKKVKRYYQGEKDVGSD